MNITSLCRTLTILALGLLALRSSQCLAAYDIVNEAGVHLTRVDIGIKGKYSWTPYKFENGTLFNIQATDWHHIPITTTDCEPRDMLLTYGENGFKHEIPKVNLCAIDTLFVFGESPKDISWPGHFLSKSEHPVAMAGKGETCNPTNKLFPQGCSIVRVWCYSTFMAEAQKHMPAGVRGTGFENLIGDCPTTNEKGNHIVSIPIPKSGARNPVLDTPAYKECAAYIQRQVDQYRQCRFYGGDRDSTAFANQDWSRYLDTVLIKDQRECEKDPEHPKKIHIDVNTNLYRDCP